MARSKKGALRGRSGGRGGGRGGRGGRSNRSNDTEDIGADFVPFAGASRSRNPALGYSMKAEALNTMSHESHWSSNQPLRLNRVIFVSAGGVEESADKANEEAMADMSLKESYQAPTIRAPQQSAHTEDVDATEEESKGSRVAVLPIPSEATVDSGSFEKEVGFIIDTVGAQPMVCDWSEDNDMGSFGDSFVIDVAGAQPVATGLPAPHIRSPSPALSNSSEEIILFGGRDSTGKAIRRPLPIYTARSFSRIVVDEVAPKSSEPQASIRNSASSTNESSLTSARGLVPKQATFMPAPASHDEEEAETSRPSIKETHGPLMGGKKSLEDALLADYIENLREQGLDPSAPFKPRDLGGSDDDVWINECDEEEESCNNGWTRSDLSDFDDLSTSDGESGGVVGAVLAQRERKSGAQYLIVWEGSSMDEARWILEDLILGEASKNKIAAFHAEEALLAEAFCSDSESDGSDDDDMLDGPDSGDDSMDDDADLKEQLKISRMSDEQIARLMAKQEELGMGSSELLLFDGFEDGDDVHDDKGFLPVSHSRRKPRKTTKTPKTPKRANGEFPSATLAADAYDGFDVMDFERSSLSIKKRTKGRKGRPVFNLSDSELERSMEDAWDLDRQKKTTKKREREELRAQGLLGKGKISGKPDMKQKYKEGMNISDIKEEMKDFLMGSNTTLSLPPMDKSYRKVVHEIASAFKLKSKSAGKGTSRFPILYRTQRSIVYTDYAFSRAESHVSRFLPRADVKGRRSAGASRGGFGGGGGGGGGYRDGDIVGGSAPELGIGNRGRAMLEKMGWSSGTALGALNNKGILQPVSHVVKTTKAGLG